MVSPSSVVPLLQLRGISRSYGPVRVLTDVDLDLRAGEVHALVGENGAGKSTLSRIICGLTTPDAGTLHLAGERYAPRDKRDATEHGVRMVMQELNLIGQLTVAESVFFERLPHRFGFIQRKRLHGATREALRKVGLDGLNPGRLVSTLGVGQQQLVEIASGLSRRCQVLILDEPTAALAAPEIESLFRRVAELKKTGVAIVYISHRMEEIRRIADRITVLRDGRVVETRAARTFPLPEIIRGMVGRDLEADFERTQHALGSTAMRVSGLSRLPAVREVSFELRQGEILGLAGLMGSGRTETVRAMVGADRPTAGEIRLGADLRPVRIRSPRDAVRLGVALLTENRKEQGLLLPMSIRANISLASLGRFCGPAGWIRRQAERRAGERWIEQLKVRCRHADQPVNELSGGNQQKIVLARWLLRDCDVLIFDEPTRGIDVGAKMEVYHLLDRLASAGKALLVVSSDLPELVRISDRIAVMSAGRLVETFRREHWTQDRIMQAALSGYVPERGP